MQSPKSIHPCKKNIIFLEEGEYKCFLCLNKGKEYLHKTEIPEVIVPMCLKIADREVFGEKYDRFTKYSKQLIFTESEIKEIMEARNIPDEEKQNPYISELKLQIRQQAYQMDQLQKQVESLKDALIPNLEKTYRQLNQLDALNEFVKKQCTVDVLNQYTNLQVQLWMIEWALRSGNMEMFERLLEKYFEGIQISINTSIKYAGVRNNDPVQVVTMISGVYQGCDLPPAVSVMNIQYQNITKYKLCRLPVETLSCWRDSDIEDRLVIYSFIKYHFKIEFCLAGEIVKNGGIYYEHKNLDINKYKKDGKILSYLEGNLFCENGKLIFK